MKFEDLDKTVYRSIISLFIRFSEDTAIFWTEADVTSYLYSLLINDPTFKKSLAWFESASFPKKSQTVLVHVNAQDETKSRRKYYDLLILKPKKYLKDEIDKDEEASVIGIEIKFDRKEPTRKEKSNIISDIRKVAQMRRGYVLWLNSGRKIGPVHLERAEKLANRLGVRLLYLDLSSKCEISPRTNVKELLEVVG
jgi:hypothetical protein